MRWFKSIIPTFFKGQIEILVQCESGFIESPLSEINFLISLAWAEGGIHVGDPMLKIEKCFEGDRAPSTPQKSENKFRVIWLSVIKESYGRSFQNF